MASADYFLKLSGMPGESKDDLHKEWIEIESFSWGVNNPDNVLGGDNRKSVFRGLRIVKHLDKTSPLLFQRAASGGHFKTAILTGRKTDEPTRDYYKVTLSDCMVSSYSSAPPEEPPGETPMDSFSLNYTKIVFEYKAPNTTGGETVVRGGWDLATNKKV